jgi:hypothetical protein
MSDFNSSLELWRGMPDFNSNANMRYKTLKIHYYNEGDLQEILKKLNIEAINHKSCKTAYYPKRKNPIKKDRVCISDLGFKNQYPVYIVSKGRHDCCLTSMFLTSINVEHKVIVEQHEYNLYCQNIKENNLLILDKAFQEKYNTCDNLGLTKSVGAGAARNFAWQHSIENGFEAHWVMDDNIKQFYRVVNNSKIKVGDGTFLKACEDFFNRYDNLAMCGLNYAFMLVSGEKQKPFVTNTRIYSCNLIKNSIPFRWRGRYNEDTILSIDILKSGLCTVQFNAFLQGKLATQVLKGGNTKDFYEKEGTFNKSRMLVNTHPDVAKLTEKYNRVHHNVDYSSFKKNNLILKGVFFNSVDNNYGMRVIEIE